MRKKKRGQRISVHITFKVHRADGTLKSKKRFLAQSWVRGFFWLWYVQISQLITLQTPTNFTIDNLSPVIRAELDNMRMDSDSNLGIVVGTSPQALDAEDNKLISIIPDGSLAGQLLRSSMTFVAPVDPVVGGTITQKINRTFTNSSGGTITVEEVGIHQRTDQLAEKVLTERTLKTQIVLNTEILTVEYDFTETV